MEHEKCGCRRRRWRWWWLAISCWIVVPAEVLTATTAAEQQQRFANEPSPQTAVIGSTVVLPCRVVNKVGELQWTRDDFGLGNERELYAFKRYHMIGSDEEGDFSLRISPVTLEDDAQFQCQVTGWKDTRGVRSQTAKLTVYVPPEPPEIPQGSSVTVTEGEVVKLECFSKGGKPAAELQWMDGLSRVMTEGVHYTSELMTDRQRSNAKSTLSFPAAKEHHNAVFTCAASNPALPNSVTAQVQLKVRYAPEVTIIHDQPGYREGQVATLTCSANANPSVLIFRWYRGGQLVPRHNSTQLVIPNITRDSTLEDVTCEVSNDVGTSKKITRINIHYKPTFLSSPTDQYAELGENITLACEVDSSPDPSIVWIRDDRVVARGPQLHIIATRNNIGAYICVARVEGFDDISATASIFLKGPPRVTSERQQWGNQGETVLVECIITAASAPSLSVTWTHHGKLVDLEKGRYEVVQDVTGKGVRHTLVIRDAKVTDFGAYKCSVHNEYGSDVSEIILTKKKTLPLLLLVCGVTGGVMLVLVVAMMVIMCAKKNASRHKGGKSYGLPEKALSLQATDQNSSANESDLKVEFDQRTGSSMSNKEVELDGWEPEVDHPSTPPYLSPTNPYLYPDTFTAVPVKTNGHLIPNGGLSYDNYADHAAMIGQQHHTPSPTRGFLPETNGMSNAIVGGGAGGGGGGIGVGGGGGGGMVVGNCQHFPESLYPMYGDYETGQDATDGVRRFSPSFTSGLGDYNFKSTCGSSPFSLQPSSRSNGTIGRTNGSIGRCNGTIRNGIDSTIPRLGIPVDPNQYIMSPKTQVLKGSLATHV